MLVLEQVPMRQDNYSYALINDNQVIMIDPSSEQDSEQYFLNRPNLNLVAIVNTHSHFDHVGGNEVLCQRFKCDVYGPKKEQARIPCINKTLNNNDVFDVMGVSFRCFDVRAHTEGHMAYLCPDQISKVLKCGHNKNPNVIPRLSGHSVMFVGDSLFAAGCGRLFEGTKEQLTKALMFYSGQDPHTLMACAHEYTKQNLLFASNMLPQNQRIKNRLATVDDLIAAEGSSVPDFFASEFVTNPFILALTQPETSYFAKKFNIENSDLSDIVMALRKAKDNY